MNTSILYDTHDEIDDARLAFWQHLFNAHGISFWLNADSATPLFDRHLLVCGDASPTSATPSLLFIVQQLKNKIPYADILAAHQMEFFIN